MVRVWQVYGGLCLWFTLMLSGCGGGDVKPTIDNTSPATLQASLERMSVGMPPEERKQWDEAVAVLGTDLLQRLPGKNAAEVIAEGRRVATERRVAAAVQAKIDADQREEKLFVLREGVKKLLEAQAEAANMEKELALFKVEAARLYFSIMGNTVRPAIEIMAHNGTSQSIARATFQIVLVSPGRAVPWLEEEFVYNIAGGIEANEKATWNLAPKIQSAWAKVPRDREDIVVNITVKSIEGVDGKSYVAGTFTERDLADLKRQQASLAALEKTK